VKQFEGKMVRKVLFLLLFFCIPGAFSSTKAQATPLTSSHELPIKKVVVAISIDTVPFHFIDDRAQPSGIVVDLWRLWSKKTQIAVEFKSASWHETLAMVRDGRADVHAGLNYNEDRDKYLDFGSPLTESNSYFFFHRNLYGLNSVDDLSPFRIGVLKGAHEVSIVRSKLPQSALVEYPDQDALYDAVQRHEVKVFADIEQTARYFLAERGIARQYGCNAGHPLDRNAFYPAVREGDTKLALIRRGFEAIEAQELAEIERKWIVPGGVRQEDVLIVASDKNYPPFTQLGVDGKPSGLFVDLWRLWAAKTGRQVEFLMTDWPDTLKALRDGIADFHSGLFRTEDRSIWLGFSAPIYEVESTLFYVPQYGQGSSFEEFAGEKVGAIRDSYHATYLRENHQSINLIVFDSIPALLAAAEKGRIKAFMDDLLPMKARMFQQNKRGQFKTLEGLRLRNQISAGLPKDNVNLLATINEGLSRIAPEEWQELEERWILDPGDRLYTKRHKTVGLTEEEKSWLDEHRNISIGIDPAWPPFEFYDVTGVYAGIASDYVRLLNERLDIKMAPLRDLSWPEVMEKAKAGEIDVLPCVVKTPERSKLFLFTAPYLNFPMVILTREEAPFINGVQDFESGRVAVVQGYASQELLESDYPDISFYLANDIDEALKAVSMGKVDAFVGNLASITYTAQLLGLTNLKVSMTTPYKYELSFAVRKDWPELVRILDKSLNSIPAPEKAAIHNHWINVRFERGVDWGLVLKLVGTPVLIGGFILVLILSWNRRLSREVSQRKKAEEAIQKSERKYRTLFENASEAILVAQDEMLRFVNPQLEKLLAFSQVELTSRPVTDFFHPDDRNMVRERHERRLKGDESVPEVYTSRIVDRYGNIKWVELKVVLIQWDDRPAAMGFMTDITDRKRAEEELNQKMQDLERFSKVAVGREERMIELKQEINEMLRGLGQPDKYEIVT
jgi:polar amino acid transport system substrate-binding protein